jgi:serine/threonine protein kinase
MIMTHEEFKKRFKYSLETDRLGEGGFGEVFKAYDNFIDKWVAIKISKVKPDFQEIRLRKEVELVNKLPAHPNIARYEECYTFSSIAGEFDFGILQYYEEGNLLQLMHNHKLTPDQKYLVLKDLLEGIEFMHKNNIIHRDLKPQNILIVKRGDYYVPKITDFGISKKLDVQKGSEYTNSLTGAGTLAYAAPEQLGGKAIRKNSDLWAFGVIAYQLLSGQLPFTSGTFGTTSEAGRQEMLRQINQGISPALLDMISQPWQMIIRYCLETDPESRIKSASDCMDILEGKSIKVPSRGSANHSKSISIDEGVTEIYSSIAPSMNLKNRKLKKRIIITGSAIALILLSVIGFSVLLKDKHETNLAEKSIAVLPAKDSVNTTSPNDVPEIKPQLKEEKGITEVKKERVATESKLTFDDGNYYEGMIKAGKMHGKGIFHFVKGGIISRNDPLEKRADAGCYIEGEWFNGDLYKGKLFDKNGIFKDEIILGRN